MRWLLYTILFIFIRSIVLARRGVGGPVSVGDGTGLIESEIESNRCT